LNNPVFMPSFFDLKSKIMANSLDFLDFWAYVSLKVQSFSSLIIMLLALSHPHHRGLLFVA